MDFRFCGNDNTTAKLFCGYCVIAKYFSATHVSPCTLVAGSKKARFCNFVQNDKAQQHKGIILILLLPLKRASGVYGESILRICEFQHVAR
jgi:hypothetical protein